jgi:hypothetical protein
VKNYFHTNKVVICFLIIAILFAVGTVGWGYSQLQTYHRSIRSVPYLFKSCLSDEAILSQYTVNSLLANDASHSDFQRLNVSKKQRSSAQFALLNYESYDLPRSVLAVAYKAYIRARGFGLDKQQILTVVDYAKSSNARRLWVFDMKHNKILYHTFVAHGVESGGITAEHFSNQPDSNESSLGVILTGKTYDGTLGYSMLLYGLDQGFNDNLLQRKIVMHPANYVDPSFIRKYHQAGRSYGCLAVSEKIAKPLINAIKNGTIVVNYYPDKQWLTHSYFLT